MNRLAGLEDRYMDGEICGNVPEMWNSMSSGNEYQSDEYPPTPLFRVELAKRWWGREGEIIRNDNWKDLLVAEINQIHSR